MLALVSTGGMMRKLANDSMARPRLPFEPMLLKRMTMPPVPLATCTPKMPLKAMRLPSPSPGPPMSMAGANVARGRDLESSQLVTGDEVAFRGAAADDIGIGTRAGDEHALAISHRSRAASVGADEVAADGVAVGMTQGAAAGADLDAHGL